MEKKKIDKLEELLKINEGKSIIIFEKGYIEGQIKIEKFKYEIKSEELYMMDEDSNNFIKINLNQSYNIENSENGMTIFLDNDIQIEIR